ncbi:MAG TPA: peptidylprolyl isomerase [Steroidobacteraceae bacterium]|nr:peptidylprolyl isomerase [Steroidobacteraceae bacterium]
MKYLSTLPMALLILLAACAKPGDTPDKAAADSDNVAVVNGSAISRNTFDYYVQGVSGKPATDATAEEKAQLLDNLVRGELIAADAEKTGVAKQPETRAILELSRLNVLQQAASQSYLKERKATDEELRAEYAAQVAALSKVEYHARHILVATEQFAQKMVEQLGKGAKFEDLAKKESMDPSKTNGGDLGWFTPDRMVKPFAEAVVGLKKGEYTQRPVQTQYGWHVIRLDDTRELAPPEFDGVKERLVQIVEAKKFKAYTDELAKTAKIEKKL